VTETAVLFGTESTLVGIVTQPDQGTASDFACLTFNAGVIPRFGPHRFNVKLARDLAKAGIISMRFDISGLGDSRPVVTGRNFVQQAVADIRAAMDFLEQHHGIHRFALIGNCSGAVHIYWASLADERVVGTLMFDGFSYNTRWTRIVRHWKRLRAGTWRSISMAVGRRLAARLSIRPRSKTEAEANMFSEDDSLATPPRDQYCQAMQTLVNRGVSVFLVFSGGNLERYSYAGQFRDSFAKEPFVDKVRCDHMPEIDHTLLNLDAQRRFISVIHDWILGVASSRRAA
jgi:pimeloyl-ACP methyl ester carboxylesterase